MSSVSGFRSFTHNETNPFETSPRIWQYGTYFDGTVVLRIINRDPNKNSSTTELWIRPVLSLRIIYPNGTVSEIDIELEIPEFNWHPLIDDYIQDTINIYALHKGYLLVTYFNTSNPDDINTYEEWGRIIDWNGNLYDKVNFSKAYIENGIWYPMATGIVTNVDPEKGFLRIFGMNATYNEWQQYTIGNTFNLNKLSEGNIVLPQNGNYALISIVATVDEGYSLIIGNSTNSTDSNNNNPLEIRTAVYALTKGYHDKQFSAPKMIYQLPLDNVTITGIFTGTSSTGIGQICALIVTQNFANFSRNYYVKLDFLSSGSITEIVPLSISVPELPSNSTSGWLLNIIPHGGYLFFGYFLDANNQTNNICAYYFNEVANNFTIWDYGESVVLNRRGAFIILPNNTILISQIEGLNAWSFNTTDIPKFTDFDHGYSNFQVNYTSPSINANILTSTKNIMITYYEPVELSYGNISIYQIDNSGNHIIRQFFKGINSFCSISDDGLTVTVKVIKSTFSNPNSQFYVKVDINFVRNKAYKESLMGIYENIWKFNTSSSEETFAETVSGALRLTKEGTEYFENLNTAGKYQFFTDLSLELSEIIPVNNIKRLSLNGKFQVDTTVSPSRQILISLRIESSKEERSVASIVDDLNVMITYKNMTSIGLESTTKYLDENFGFKPNQKVWDQYKWRFLGVILVLAILVTFFLIAQKIESKGRNIAVLQLGLIIFDFVMDVLFVSKNGKIIEVLYIPSVVFLIVPIGINTVWAFYIISDENKSKTFLDWFTRHEKVASVFTVLSSADIETLSILHSNMAGLKFFQAPISIKGKNRIFWVSFLTIFVEDIPQLIIQIIYYHRIVTYDIIPLLALVSSCLSLLINIIGRLFQAINSCQPQTLECDSPQNQDGFDSFQQLQTSATERSFTLDKSLSNSIDVNEEEKDSEK
ncbi:555_t:CDS:2, partial [Diversispora eburnea]